MLEALYKFLGLATKKELQMLRDDLKNQLNGLSKDVDDLKVRIDQAMVEANANSVTQADVDQVVNLRAKVNAVLSPGVDNSPSA